MVCMSVKICSNDSFIVSVDFMNADIIVRVVMENVLLVRKL